MSQLPVTGGHTGDTIIRRLMLVPLQLLGFALGFSLTFYAVLIVGLGLGWWGWRNLSNWQGVPGGSYPGSYVPPAAPAAVPPAPAPGRPGVVLPVPPAAASPPAPVAIIPASQLPRVRPPIVEPERYAIPRNDYDEPRYPIRMGP